MSTSNPDSIPRYAEPTWDEYAEMDNDGISYLCDTCKHCIDVLDGKARHVPVCIVDHHKRGLLCGTEITTRIDDCEEWERADE